MEQDVVQNLVTTDKNGCDSIRQESPALVMSALKELGNRILRTNGEMEERMADKFQEQIK